LGGDEFVVLVNGVDVSTGPVHVAQRLLDVMRTPFVLEDRTDDPLSVTASIGIATARDEMTSGDLLRNADLALYRAKAAGRNCSETYDPTMAGGARPVPEPKAAIR